ncbi:MAG: hypothetical protein DI563_03625 [Variovorax paradoxus]|uniref:ABM domain-containing protein n=1 Tax=Variovorax paradoxus TaxID=34073 RepID=A0A2W5S404_VARPD|nr:MAG: hypothetical protein DI563_03625 [Variovorax paradoxus]
MTRYFSILPLTAAPEVRSDAVATFIENGVIETCRDVIPGFINGSLLQSRHDPSSACVLVEWRDEMAYEAWMNSPHRGGGKRLFDPPGRSHLYELVHRVDR